MHQNSTEDDSDTDLMEDQFETINNLPWNGSKKDLRDALFTIVISYFYRSHMRSGFEWDFWLSAKDCL
ncbi:hypothetical protein EG68_07783 [Paragonimus skrjabini miyazakii]|uniref:Uncharacterized protein n=1 Tax=Paragonimus skrjabini miyazakii TaxID=59628 RepID=A0A8S9YWF6_9TREM|nr:hypothetical protein EG68_07783 [Paragonimus skrjabini miyazakii]